MNELVWWQAGLAVSLGLVAHYAKKLKEASDAHGSIVNPIGYFTSHIYTTILTLVGVAAGAWITHEAGMLNAVAAFGIGYMGDSAAGAFGDRGRTVAGVQ